MATGLLQTASIVGLLFVGFYFNLQIIYFSTVLIAAGLMLYQQYLIKQQNTELYFDAFMNNQWVGAIIFLGIALDYAVLH